MRLRLGLILAGVVLLALAPAVAAARADGGASAPRILPARDVMVVYRIAAPGHPAQTWRVRYRAAGELVRARGLDGPAAGVVALLDIPAGRAQVVLAQMHAVVEIPGLSATMAQVLALRGARFTRLGTARIAGHDCTRYLVLRRDADGTACITTGGVVLAAAGKDGHGSASVRAESVAQRPQDPGLFVPPAGYAPITLPPSMLAGLLGGG